MDAPLRLSTNAPLKSASTETKSAPQAMTTIVPSFPSCEGNVVSTSSSDNPHLQ
jgi:hypothetical protein